MTSVATRVAALCNVIQEHRRTGTAISGRRAAAISAMIDDVAATAAEGRPRAYRRKRRMANARGYKQEGRRVREGERERGVVVRARHRGTGQAVAVNVKSLHRRSGGSRASDVLREACFTAAPLAGRVPHHRDGRPFTEAEARRVMRQLLAGAEAMHRHGVVHRDIKPENILVGAGAVKICNYGVAKSVAEKDPPQAFAGTMAYMAPEVLVKNADHDTLADVWSLGCVMVEILTGKLPFVVAAKDEDDEGKQLFKIFDVLGVPCKRVWEALKPQRERKIPILTRTTLSHIWMAVHALRLIGPNS
ncbi:hypothetical protein BDA96_08G154100 [Sorghum bicolor]|uniref:Protein kinase domain-containing protein n=1 Tax=Sorghum bicolor TaxID=4558 RepID=A0A921U7N7_SORBI|nr:hypothetical protein BDA96_08G154100 [Sorghum bicolor]